MTVGRQMDSGVQMPEQINDSRGARTITESGLSSFFKISPASWRDCPFCKWSKKIFLCRPRWGFVFRVEWRVCY